MNRRLPAAGALLCVLLSTACGSRADFTLVEGRSGDADVVTADQGGSAPTTSTTGTSGGSTASTGGGSGAGGASGGLGTTSSTGTTGGTGSGTSGGTTTGVGSTGPVAGGSNRAPIRLSYIIQGTAGVGAITGNNTQGDSDVAARNMNALVAYANDHGGVGGRKIAATGQKSEATSTQEERLALCKHITEDLKAQVVIDANQYLTEESWACFAQHKVNYLGTVTAADNSFLEKYSPYISTTWLSLDRTMHAAVDGGSATGFFKGGKVGVLLADVPTMHRLEKSILAPAFAKAGVSGVTYRYITNDSGGGQQAQTNSAVLAFASAGINRIVFLHNILVWIGFTNQASSQGYKPLYEFSDYQGMAGVAAAYSSAARGQNENAIAVSSSGGFVWDDDSVTVTDATAPIDRNKAEPATRRCLDILTKYTKKNYYDPNDSGDTLSTWAFYCDEFFAWWEAAKRIGNSWTPADTRRGLSGLGTSYLSTIQHTTNWARGLSAASSYRAGRFDSDCSCFVKITPWRPI